MPKMRRERFKVAVPRSPQCHVPAHDYRCTVQACHTALCRHVTLHCAGMSHCIVQACHTALCRHVTLHCDSCGLTLSCWQRSTVLKRNRLMTSTYPASSTPVTCMVGVPMHSVQNTGRVLIIHNRGDWRGTGGPLCINRSYVLYYATRHCTPSSSTSFFLNILCNAVCCTVPVSQCNQQAHWRSLFIFACSSASTCSA